MKSQAQLKAFYQQYLHILNSNINFVNHFIKAKTLLPEHLYWFRLDLIFLKAERASLKHHHKIHKNQIDQLTLELKKFR